MLEEDRTLQVKMMMPVEKNFGLPVAEVAGNMFFAPPISRRVCGLAPSLGSPPDDKIRFHRQGEKEAKAMATESSTPRINNLKGFDISCVTKKISSG